MISVRVRALLAALVATGAWASVPSRAEALAPRPVSAVAAALRGGDLVQLGQARDERAGRRAGPRRGAANRPSRARGSGGIVTPNVPRPTLPSYSIMVPEPGMRPPPPAVQVVPGRVQPPTAIGGMPTVSPPAVTPNPETFNDRVVRCTHSAGVSGISPGQTGVYISNCAN